MGLSIAAGGWMANLIVFLITEFNVKSIAATKIYNVVLACSCFFPVAGAIIADSFFGSFPVVATFAFVSLLVIKYVAFYIFIIIIIIIIYLKNKLTTPS